MALFERLESRALSYQTIFRTGLDTFPARPESGFFVDAETSMRDTAIWAAQRLITGDVSTLPVEAFVKDDTGTRTPLRPKPSWIEEPDPYDVSFTRISHFGEVTLSILQDGNSFTLVDPSVLSPTRLEVLRPNLVQPHKSPGELTPSYAISDARGRIVDQLTPLNIIHIAPFRKPGQLRGLNPIEAASEGIGISLAAERYTSRYFLSGASMPGFITAPGDLTQPQIDQMDAQLRKSKGGWRNAGVLAYLTGGATYTPTGIKPADSDLSATRQFQLEEICRRYGIPPHMLGISERGAGGPVSVEQRGIDYVTHCLRHYLEPIEVAYRRLVPGDASTYLKFNLAGLLRGDIAARYESYNIGIRDGFLSVNDVRRLEDMAPVKGGEAYRQQAQMTDLTDQGQTPAGQGGNVTGAPLEPPAPTAPRALEIDVRTSSDDLARLTTSLDELRAVLERPVEPPVVNLPPPVVNVPAPVVNVKAPVVNVPAPVVNVAAPAPDFKPLETTMSRGLDALRMAVLRPKTVLRDDTGAVIGTD